MPVLEIKMNECSNDLFLIPENCLQVYVKSTIVQKVLSILFDMFAS